MRANVIKVPCLFLAFFRQYLRGYRGKKKFGLASSKLSVSRDKRKKMCTHTKKICMSTEKMKFAFRFSPLNERADLATFTYLRRFSDTTCEKK